MIWLAQPCNRGRKYIISISVIYLRLGLICVLWRGGGDDHGPVCETRFRRSFVLHGKWDHPSRYRTEHTESGRNRDNCEWSLCSYFVSRPWWGVVHVHAASVLVMTTLSPKSDNTHRATTRIWAVRLEQVRRYAWNIPKYIMLRTIFNGDMPSASPRFWEPFGGGGTQYEPRWFKRDETKPHMAICNYILIIAAICRR